MIKSYQTLGCIQCIKNTYDGYKEVNQNKIFRVKIGKIVNDLQPTTFINEAL